MVSPLVQMKQGCVKWARMCFYTFAFECSRFVADDEVTGLENLHTIKTNAFFFFSQEQMIRGSNLCLEFRQTGMTVGNPCLEPQASSLPAERIGKIHESLQGSASLSAKWVQRWFPLHTESRQAKPLPSRLARAPQCLFAWTAVSLQRIFGMIFSLLEDGRSVFSSQTLSAIIRHLFCLVLKGAPGLEGLSCRSKQAH